MNIRSLKQRGDTIVEVMIATAIISLVLAGAYVTTHKSLIATRDAQEHSEALKLLQSQIEAMRAGSISDTSGNYFCIVENGSTVTESGTFTSVTPLITGGSHYPSACAQTVGTETFGYYISVQYDATQKVYNFSARWNSLGGNQNEVDLLYRV